ncbi:carboxypeptidase-like regulatory domain-containing protein [Ekhidna sp.]|uniref:carboxypeptidase-like regulatory domain-containing protein n=1 Tax=Ekhidna sp. TaxID=2608089 RepID=UPI003B5B4C53
MCNKQCLRSQLIKFFILFLLFDSYYSLGQNSSNKLKGSILDRNDSSGLEFAHVYLKNSTIGTYTNTNGEFLFYYPDSLAQDTLVVSRIGYTSYNLALGERDTTTTDLSIYLSESKDYLDEVVVYAKKDTVVSIVKKAIKRFRKNYPTRLHYLEGFYRELSLKGDEYTRLIEASVGITENSYRKAETKTKIKVRQIRKSEDYRDYSIKAKLYLAAMKLAMGESFADYNNLSKMLKMNFAKIDRGKITIWFEELNFIEAFDFEIAKVTVENGHKRMHISFQMPLTASAVSYSAGELVINMEDYAIIEWKYGQIPHPSKAIKKLDVMYYKGRFHRHNHIIYSKIEDKYYPTFFEMYEPILKGEKHVYEDGRKEYQFDKITFMVNQVITRKRDFDRIKNREALEEDLDLYDTDHSYDPEFWANYNLLLLDPLLKPAKEDLEKEKSLETQFEDNGE